MRIVFLGTPKFAVTCLEKLLESRHEVVAVVTQPDKPSDRGNKIEFSEVKKYCLQRDLPLYQFTKISRDGVVDLSSLQPDIMITAAYGQLLSQQILDIAKFGVINVHASILPKYRGASPIQTAIMRGESETGVTIMKTEIGLDTGDIIDVVKTPIFENETTGDLSDRLAMLGSNLLLEVLDNIENGTAKYTPQDDIHATVTTKISKNDCSIIWEKSSREIKALIHGANPNPIARTMLGDEQIKIYRAKVADIELTEEDNKLLPGTVLPRSSVKAGVFVKTADGALELLEMQFPGGKVLTAKILANGRKINPYDAFKTVIKIR
ncbi:MAG: methionyl-tRNA formyltransferase [Clostridia bacterium]|nr:methionyl-tRNA formyltransferase [Clostridiales bacterium]MBQ7917302.1 methionyl-tRNA formyltransferase [Clostridia bacterium]